MGLSPRYRLIPRGLFSKKPKPPVEDRYGDDKTIHRVGHVDVEIGPDGNVCAVWFRCRLLPFSSSRVIDSRASDMRESMIERAADIKAIIFEEPPL